MPHTRDWAIRLLGRLKLPAEATTMLEQSSYWDPTVAEIYFERCDDAIFNNPGAGLELAKLAPRLALLIPEAEDDLAGHRERLIQAYAILGGAHRAAGDHPRADEVYSLALRLAAEGEVSRLARARLHDRLAVLRTCQKRYREAQELLEPAIVHFRQHAQVVDLASALTKLGYCHMQTRLYGEAIESFGEALKLIPNPNVSGEAARTQHAALHNLADVASRSGRSEELDKVRVYARRASRLIRNRRSVPKAKLRWVEARVLIRLGLTRRGEAYLESARRSLLELRAPFDYALVSLELSALWHSEGRWARLEALAAETYKVFRELGGSADSESLAALSLWVDGVRLRTLSQDLIRDAARRIEARLPISGLRPR